MLYRFLFYIDLDMDVHGMGKNLCFHGGIHTLTENTKTCLERDAYMCLALRRGTEPKRIRVYASGTKGIRGHDLGLNIHCFLKLFMKDVPEWETGC